jgi:hypothetical protein
MSDGEQEVQWVAQDKPSDLEDQDDYQDAQESQDADEISQLATELEKRTRISIPGLALPPSLGVDLADSDDLGDSAGHSGNSHQPRLPDFDNSVATRLADRLYSFHGCTNSAHEEQGVALSPMKPSGSEVERYLSEPLLKESDKKSYAEFWQGASTFYPILGRMARDYGTLLALRFT